MKITIQTNGGQMNGNKGKTLDSTANMRTGFLFLNSVEIFVPTKLIRH